MAEPTQMLILSIPISLPIRLADKSVSQSSVEEMFELIDLSDD
jgi:hypothetical protein